MIRKRAIIIVGIVAAAVIVALFFSFSSSSFQSNVSHDSWNQNSSILCLFGDDPIALLENDTSDPQEIYLRLQNVTDDSEKDLESYYYPDGPVLGHGYDKNGMVVLIYKEWDVNKTVLQDIYSVIERHGEQNGIKRIFTRFLPIGLMKPDSSLNQSKPENSRQGYLPGPVPAPTPLAFEPTMTKVAFSYGEIIPITTEIQNSGDTPVNLSGIPPKIVVSIRKSGYNRGVVRTIPAGGESLTLGPRSKQTWIVSWDQKDDKGMQVEPGVYYLTMTASGLNAYGEVVIVSPDGALTGSISPGENVTSNGITIQLQSLTLNENGGLVTVRIINPLSTSPSDGVSHLSQVTADYRIDDGPSMNFRDISQKNTKDGRNTITWQTAPVPCTAKKLNIHATKFDPYRGNWSLSTDLDSIPQCTFGNGTTVTRENKSNNQVSKPALPALGSVSLGVIMPAIALGICTGLFYRKNSR